MTSTLCFFLPPPEPRPEMLNGGDCTQAVNSQGLYDRPHQFVVTSTLTYNSFSLSIRAFPSQLPAAYFPLLPEKRKATQYWTFPLLTANVWSSPSILSSSLYRVKRQRLFCLLLKASLPTFRALDSIPSPFQELYIFNIHSPLTQLLFNWILLFGFLTQYILPSWKKISLVPISLSNYRSSTYDGG